MERPNVLKIGGMVRLPTSDEFIKIVNKKSGLNFGILYCYNDTTFGGTFEATLLPSMIEHLGKEFLITAFANNKHDLVTDISDAKFIDYWLPERDINGHQQYRFDISFILPVYSPKLKRRGA